MDYLRLVRPWIVAMVLLAMMAAAWTADGSPPAWPALGYSLLGAGLVIIGAVALNQRIEMQGDAQMPRTAQRPLPSGRLARRQATRFGVLASAAGLLWLAMLAPVGVTLLAAVSWAIYVGVYTPMKLVSPWQTLVGALAGAMPVLLGAAATGAMLSPVALALFGIVFLWQLPHSMAIGWLYREQFEAAGVKLATVVDRSGRVAGIVALLGALLLLPASLSPPLLERSGGPYAVAAAMLGGGYLICAIRFLWRRDDSTARWLLRASLLYLPGVFLALL